MKTRTEKCHICGEKIISNDMLIELSVDVWGLDNELEVNDSISNLSRFFLCSWCASKIEGIIQRGKVKEKFEK